MTNGEKIKQIFPGLQIDEGELYAYLWLPCHDAIDIPLDWWNEEYKEPTKKYCGCCKHWKIKGVKKIGDKPTSYGKCTKLSISGFEVETTFNDDCSSESLKCQEKKQ